MESDKTRKIRITVPVGLCVRFGWPLCVEALLFFKACNEKCI